MEKQFISKSLTPYVSIKCIECKQCEFRVLPDDKGRCPVCGVRLELAEQIG